MMRCIKEVKLRSGISGSCAGRQLFVRVKRKENERTPTISPLILSSNLGIPVPFSKSGTPTEGPSGLGTGAGAGGRSGSSAISPLPPAMMSISPPTEMSPSSPAVLLRGRVVGASEAGGAVRSARGSCQGWSRSLVTRWSRRVRLTCGSCQFSPLLADSESNAPQTRP